MSGTEEAPEQFCGSCVHECSMHGIVRCSSIRKIQTDGDEDGDEPRNGPHDCEHWHPSDAHRQALAAERQAEAMEGLELAALVMAGLWVEPIEDEAPADIFHCSCGLPLSPSRDETEIECPNCHLCYIGDGSGKWIEKA